MAEYLYIILIYIRFIVFVSFYCWILQRQTVFVKKTKCRFKFFFFKRMFVDVQI